MRDNNKLIDPLIKKGNVYKLKCEKCNSLSVQITEEKEPDLICLECGGNCKTL